MCGIVAAIGRHDVVPILMEGLQRLEYRGYDSAGIAVINGHLQRVRAVGRVSDMRRKLNGTQLQGFIGVGHTRWATHGGVTENNAHPHVSQNEIAVVHNGIIENHEAQRRQLAQYGYCFDSQTDSEIIAHLIHYHFRQDGDLFRATCTAVRELIGAYAIAVVATHSPEVVTCARMGCPLLIGLGEGENFIASDVSALLPVSRRIIYLEDGDVAELHRDRVVIVDRIGARVERKVRISDASQADTELGPYRHYMQKEIHEQPRALGDTVDAIATRGFVPELFGAAARELFSDVNAVQILAAGTSYHAGLTARHWLEDIAGLPVAVDIASEYRYRRPASNPRQLVVSISQSGETMDTLEALKRARALGHHKTLAICNVCESTIARASALVFYTRAGVEIGVASTKAFTTQLVALFALAVTLGRLHGRVSAEQAEGFLRACRDAIRQVQYALNLEVQLRQWAAQLAPSQHALFLGRGIHYPIALEGALKLKEISYIHAEAYPAGELKHGPLALVDSSMPVVVIAPNDALLEKIKSNMQEVRARGGKLFVVADADSELAEEEGVHILHTPRHIGALSPIVHAVPLQLLAYHAALQRGTDVDKPRNLAKSVTVE